MRQLEKDQHDLDARDACKKRIKPSVYGATKIMI